MPCTCTIDISGAMHPSWILRSPSIQEDTRNEDKDKYAQRMDASTNTICRGVRTPLIGKGCTLPAVLHGDWVELVRHSRRRELRMAYHYQTLRSITLRSSITGDSGCSRRAFDMHHCNVLAHAPASCSCLPQRTSVPFMIAVDKIKESTMIANI